MARQVKSKTTESTTTTENVVVPPVSVNVVETVPTTEVKTKVVKAKKPKVEKSEVTPVVVDSVTASSSTDVVVLEVDSSNIMEQSTELLAKLQQVGNLISAIKVEYRSLEKKWQRELKVAQKQSSKRKRKAGNRAPSGFVKPTRISDELAKFLEKPAGSEMARTEVTRDINKYIRTNNLQDKENGRKINPDSKLTTLLRLKKTDELTYFNLQRYMSPHFAKAVKPEVVAASV
jgi:upstream activation factor subunit UAF30